ncbi:FAD-binding protein [Nocardioides flavescens]|uniref:FAD-binding protein n=1 Tax=Nocardioides flavescens TaxID=2691959 RepID=A0A6L7ELY6_9ACTN|nr:FAD-binding protein [Nocardioides flavescens]
MRNWAGNVTYTATEVAEPASLPELQEAVAAARRVRATGSGHSFNDVVDVVAADDLLVSTRGLPGEVVVDRDAGLVEVPGRTTYADLGASLHRDGWALPNTGSLPHISVAGAAATGTHGSGVGNGCLASAVAAVELVRADGELETLREGDPEFPGAVLSLGSLGVVTRLWLHLQPTYDVAQDVLLDVPSDVVVERGADLLSSAWSVSLFTRFSDPSRIDSVWRKRRVGHGGDTGDATETWGGRVAETAVHPIVGLDASAATEQLGVPGPWHERLPHFRAAFTPSVGDELQSEFFVPLDVLGELWPRLVEASPEFRDALQVSEIRAIAPDEMWLSPFRGGPMLAVHFTWVSDLEVVRPALAAAERVLAAYDPRPHWGKVYGPWWDTARVAAAYPELPRFQALGERLDPERCFVNRYVERLGVR